MKPINIIAGASLTLASVILMGNNKDVYNRASNYLKNRPFETLAEVVRTPEFVPGDQYYDNRYTQSKLDSVAYSDIFYQTNASKNNTTTLEFNKIAQNNRPNNLDELNRILAKQTSKKEYNDLQKKAQQYNWMNGYKHEYLQHKNDSIAYRNFFEKHNLLTPQTLKKFNEISNKIRP